ncbi:putative isxac3 transposase orfb (fragment) protein [Xanthomonas albilineans GPE PC73]|uniref:Putative isxac3 transposase orfb protein n=1 Tax=Xanthomonas albilineans (strain GPE PC73 / CFBP 7063) TaxID=380358 RepID=D2UCN3_XANAP
MTNRRFKTVEAPNGWTMRDPADTDLILQTLLSALWRRDPKPAGLVHPDQASAQTRDDGPCFLAAHGLVRSTRRRGNCHDNAPMQSFFGLLKRERIRHP